MVYKCFLRVAADVLKIKLTAEDVVSTQVLQLDVRKVTPHLIVVYLESYSS